MRGVKRMKFFKKLIKETEEMLEVQEINKGEKKGLTVRRIAHAMHTAAYHRLDNQVTRIKGEYPVTTYEFTFDKSFKMIVETGNNPDKVQRIEVILTDKEHTMIPFSFEKPLSQEDKDVSVVWKEEGPWATIIEKRVQKIEEALVYKLEQQKIEEIKKEEHFKRYFPYVDEEDESKELSYFKLKHVLGLAKWVNVLKEDEVYNEYYYKVGKLEQEHIKLGPFIIMMFHSKDEIRPLAVIELNDGRYEKEILRKSVTSKGNIEIEDVFWRNALYDKIQNIENRLKEKKEKEKREAEEYFIRKYSI